MCGFVVLNTEKIAVKDFEGVLKRVYHRGPDNNSATISNGISWGFNRLSIMDLSAKGNQPFVSNDCEVVCNGEIYNYHQLKNMLKDEYTFKSSSDCEVLIPLYKKFGLDILCRYLDAEFAMVLYDSKTNSVMAARDPMGIRPMFYGYTNTLDYTLTNTYTQTSMFTITQLLPGYLHLPVTNAPYIHHIP